MTRYSDLAITLCGKRAEKIHVIETLSITKTQATNTTHNIATYDHPETQNTIPYRPKTIPYKHEPLYHTGHHNYTIQRPPLYHTGHHNYTIHAHQLYHTGLKPQLDHTKTTTIPYSGHNYTIQGAQFIP